MAFFTYKGRSSSGAVTGEIEADTRQAASAALRQKGVMATEVKEKKVKAPGEKKIKGSVKDKELAIFTRQFSVMIDSGLPIAQALNILAEQSESKPLRECTTVIAKEIESGSTLAEAFRKFPKIFDDLFTNLIEAGESGGVLDVVLQRLSGYIEKAASLKAKVKSAMVYPITIISVAVLVVAFMMIFIIPTFAKMFKDLGQDLPLPTAVVLWLSDLFRGWWWAMAGGIYGFMRAFKMYYATDKGSMVVDTYALKVPVVGMLIRKVAVARFTRTLGTLISSGVAILEALRITARSAGNRVVEKSVMAARTAVAGGRTLTEPLRQSPVFPPMVVHMISVGEATGALDTMLSKIADFYEEEVDNAVGALTSLLEPLMIVFLGVCVGGIVVAMYMPIFKMVTLVK
ncbi:MAG: type II secretion system F family protein [Candidatus Rokubacteria bacterium]|nr:type II secretion system F family protein [Candidatus Rokubacteria bacterium]